MRLATSEVWNDRQTGEQKQKTEWHRIIFWRKPAEIIAQYCHKGDQLYLEGKLETRKWQDQAGGGALHHGDHRRGLPAEGRASQR